MMNIKKYNLMVLLSLLIFSGCQQVKDPLFGGSDSGYWEVISELDGDFNKLFFLDSSMGWIVGNNGKIFATNDGGVKWNEQQSNINNDLRSVVFVNDKIGFVTGNDRTLLYTNDGGFSWNRKIVSSDSGTIYESIHRDNGGNVWFISNYGEIFKSTDLGDNWERQYQLKSWGYSYLFFPNDTGFAISAWGNTLLRTEDCCKTWKSFSLPVQYSGDVFFINQNTGWISENWGPSSTIHENVALFFTGNGGETWTKISVFPGLILDNIIFVDEYFGWLCAITKIYHTSDGGNNWICQYNSENSELGFIKDLFFVDSKHGWGLTYKGKIIRYTK